MQTQIATHTPGPWLLHRDDNYFQIVPADQRDCLIASVDQFAPTDGDMETEGRANALLIAAAPDMLAALRLVESEYGYIGDADTCECGEYSDGIIDGKPCEHRRVRAAIAKATGVNP